MKGNKDGVVGGEGKKGNEASGELSFKIASKNKDC